MAVSQAAPRIELKNEDVEAALPRIAKSLPTYCRIQAEAARTNVRQDREFQTLFNGFYRVRRGAEWRLAFFNLFERTKRSHADYAQVLRELHRVTGRVEASFASKLVATIDPAQPVIDSFVLRNVGLRLQTRGTSAERLAHAVTVHARLGEIVGQFLKTRQGRHVMTGFRTAYGPCVTEEKMVDLVLWQTRRK